MNGVKVALTSVTFRRKTPEEILALAARCGVELMEWGGDIHVPAGDLRAASRVRTLSKQAGVGLFSYGSYYKLLSGMDPTPWLESAATLGATVMRIWAGDPRKGLYDPCEEEFLRATGELEAVCEAAARYDLMIALEKHRNTLTQDPQTARRLLEAVGRANLRSYWQPNPELDTNQNVDAIRMLKRWIVNVHVFAWTSDNMRLPLKAQAEAWQSYVQELGEMPYTLEFVKDDSEEQLIQDVATLRHLLQTAG